MESCFHIFELFTGTFGGRKVQRYLSVQVTVLLENLFSITFTSNTELTTLELEADKKA